MFIYKMIQLLIMLLLIDELESTFEESSSSMFVIRAQYLPTSKKTARIRNEYRQCS
jgi:hypothetical protein